MGWLRAGALPHVLAPCMGLLFLPESESTSGLVAWGGVSRGALGGVPPALGTLTGVPHVPQAAVTYGQADLQKHCLAFIESYTMVWLQGETGSKQGHGVGQGNGATRMVGLELGRKWVFWEKVLEARLGMGRGGAGVPDRVGVRAVGGVGSSSALAGSGADTRLPRALRHGAGTGAAQRPPGCR